MRSRDLLTSAVEQIGDLTGLPVEAVSAFESDGDDGWLVTVELLELERVPNTMDVLASYEITLDDDGEVVGFSRVRRYARGSTAERQD